MKYGPNKALHRTAHKVRRPVNADVRQKKMKIFTAMVLAIISTGYLAGTSYADTNYITITSATHSNGSLYISITCPPSQLLTMDWSHDLQTWSPLYLITNEVGGISRVGFVGLDGHAEITHTISPSESNAFFRAIPWDLSEPLIIK